MADNRTPRRGDVYRDADGDLLLFVDTVKRPGRSVWTGAGPDDYEHLFVGASFHKWYLAEDGRLLPERLELVVNAGADERIEELEGQVVSLKAEHAGLVEALKMAIGVVPVPVANELRRIYARHRDGVLKSSDLRPILVP